jgi:hypothetical protein
VEDVVKKSSWGECHRVDRATVGVHDVVVLVVVIVAAWWWFR